ncbi:MAG: hypothetical protein H0T79_01795 [Deltaproteobacteria bacterium]|nr:hypothetical protein [Deltaproteobacteria bacterium]
MKSSLVLTLLACVGCYTGAAANHDVSQVWRGRARVELEERWGSPAAAVKATNGDVLTWSHTQHHVELPAAFADIRIEPDRVDITAAASGGVWNTTEDTFAFVDAPGRVVELRGPVLRYGAPADANLRWGALLGLHVGIGRLGNTSTPLPSGGAYIGGMLSPTLGLVGTFALASGSDDAGGAIGLGWGVALQYWPITRLWVRAGPAMLLGFDPGFENGRLAPGATTGASYALVRSRVFVLDLRVDAAIGTSLAFGSVGVGVNIN